jgi:hypothetical protein
MPSLIHEYILQNMKLYLDKFVSKFNLEKHIPNTNEKIHYLAYEKKYLRSIEKRIMENCNNVIKFEDEYVDIKQEYKRIMKSITKKVMYDYILDKKERIRIEDKKLDKIVVKPKTILKSSKPPKVKFNPLIEVKIISRERE